MTRYAARMYTVDDLARWAKAGDSEAQKELAVRMEDPDQRDDVLSIGHDSGYEEGLQAAKEVARGVLAEVRDWAEELKTKLDLSNAFSELDQITEELNTAFKDL